MKIIGIAGRARVGKTTLAKAIEYKAHFLGKKVAIIGFADPIKEMLALCGVNVSDANKNTTCPIFGETPRRLMQTLGTDWPVMLGIDRPWVKIWQRRVEQSGADIVVVPDARFDPECSLIRSLGGFVVHMTRPETSDMRAVPNHASEAGVQFVAGDLKFRNDSGMPKLEQFASKLIDL